MSENNEVAFGSSPAVSCGSLSLVPFVLVPLLAAILATNTVNPVPPLIPKIVGGKVSEPGAWPSVAAIMVADGSICTGVLIDADTILTAAHCFLATGPLDVYFGDEIFSDTTVAARVARFATHPEFCERTQCGDEAFDFAYIELQDPLTVEPSPLLLSQSEWDATMAVDAEVVLVGFGVHESERDTLDGLKREVLTSITDFTSDHRQFRAGAQGKDSCRGDSGGPAFVQLEDRFLVAGTLSEGTTECGNGGWYGIPLAVASWLVSEGVYEPMQACTELDCIDRSPARGGCSVQPTTTDPTLMLMVLLAVCGWRRPSRWTTGSRA